LYFYFYFVSDQVSPDDRVALDDNQIIRGEEDRKNVVNFVASQLLESQIVSSSRAVERNTDAGRRRDKARVAAEEFPLPGLKFFYSAPNLAAQEAQLHAQGPEHPTLQEQKMLIQSSSPTNGYKQ